MYKNFAHTRTLMKSFADEIGIIIYAAVLLITLFTGTFAMNYYFIFRDNYELKISGRKRPIRSIEGVIAVISNAQSLPIIFSNLNEWALDLEHIMNNVEILYFTSNEMKLQNENSTEISKYITQIIVDDCPNFIVDGNCKFTKGLGQIIDKYHHLKWVMRIEANTYVNPKGLKEYIDSLENNFYQHSFLKAGIRKSDDSFSIDHRSGWLMSQKTARDWSYVKMSYDNNNLDETPNYLLELLNIDIDSIPDEHFITYSFTQDDFQDAISAIANFCPKSYKYFGFLPRYTLPIEKLVTLNFESNYEKRIQAVRKYKNSFHQKLGIVMNEWTGVLCKLPKNL